MLSFGQKVRAIRTEAGFSQAYLAELIGVSAQSVSNWECDNTMPDISQIVPLAGALSVSTDFLLGMGVDEAGDKKNLEEKIDTIWATYSVNTKKMCLIGLFDSVSDINLMTMILLGMRDINVLLKNFVREVLQINYTRT